MRDQLNGIIAVFQTAVGSSILPSRTMKKRVFIVHGWEGHPEEGWFPWLKKELEAKRFEVFVPQLPYADNPKIQSCVPKLAEVVGNVDENTYFVGHSMGCQTIARYLETLPESAKVGGAVFVAGFFKRLTELEDDPNTQETAKHQLGTPIALSKVKIHLADQTNLSRSVAIFSDDDPYVAMYSSQHLGITL